MTNHSVNTLSDISFDETDLIRSVTKECFYEFVREFWSVIIEEAPVWNWHIKYLCNELQKVAERVFLDLPKEYDLIINISPGSTKSTICSIMFPAWVWTRMSPAQIIGGSYNKELSMDLSRKNRDVILSDKYRASFGNIQLRADQFGKSFFMNTKGGWRYATSTGGTITGFHGHFIIVDDPIDPNRAVSEVELKATNDWMTGTLSQRKVDQAKTPTILIMQRLHQDDPTNNMIERIKYAQQIAIDNGEKEAPLRLRHICLPAEKTPKIRPRKLRRYYKDNLMDPIRLGWSVINEKKTGGDFFYAGQFLQDPVPLGGGMIKVERIVIDTPINKWLGEVRFWDKAGTADGGAYSVGLLMKKHRDGRYWILDIVRGRWSSEIREQIIKQTAMVDGYKVIIGIEQEPGSGGKESAENTIKSLAGWSVFIDKPSGSTGSKILRADPFSVQVNAGNVSMIQAEWNNAFLEELRFFPFSKYKDQVDAASGAFNRLSERKRIVGGFFPVRKKGK